MKPFWQLANYLKLALLIATIFTVFIYTGCKEKDDDGTTYSDDLIASFQYDISANNTFQVTFSNYSQKAVSYSWSFGDGNTSTEENPTHIYAVGGEYEVVLTVMNEVDESNSKTRVVSITDPDLQLKLLTGEVSKTWYLQREGIALGIGTGLDNTIHWSLGGITPLGDRPCVLDDKYTFHKDGTFEFNSNNSLYIDDVANGGWISGNTGGCFNENTQNFTASTGEDLSVFGNGGDYTFDYNQTESTLTINGEGAYIGLVNKTSSGNSYIPIATKKYTIFGLAEGGIADTLKIAIEPIADADYWNFYLVSYKNEADLPSLPSAMPLANFGFTNDGNTYTFTNSSSNAVSYSWDLGDGATSTEANPVHTYSGEGEYIVTLTVQDDMGNSDSTTQTIIISSAVFTAFKLSSDDGKVWRLSGDASYYVGPTSGSSEWWSMDASATADRGCQMDDEFIFFNNGDFNYDTKGDVFADDFVCGSASCISEDGLIAPFDAFASGNHAFEVIGEGENAKIKVIGTGAFFGFNKGSNGAEIDCGLGNLPDEIIYDVIGYSSISGKETITISVEFITADNTPGWWTMVLESIE